MNEAVLSYFNRVRVCPYPNIAGVGGSGGLVPSAAYGDLPTNPGYVANPPFTAPTTLGGRLSNGWLELTGLRSASQSGFAPNPVGVGHQLSPGNAAPVAPGRFQPLQVQLAFNHYAAATAELWALLPGGPTAPWQGDLAALAPAARAYALRAKGRLVWEFMTPEGLRLRTLGFLGLPSPWEAPEDSDRMTTTAVVNGSGRPLLVVYDPARVIAPSGQSPAGQEWVLYGTAGFDSTLAGAGGMGPVLVGGPGGGLDSTLSAGGPWDPDTSLSTGP